MLTKNLKLQLNKEHNGAVGTKLQNAKQNLSTSLQAASQLTFASVTTIQSNSGSSGVGMISSNNTLRTCKSLNWQM